MGKSIFSVSLAKELKSKRHSVGLLDLDMSSPCLPYLTNIKRPVEVDRTGFQPAITTEGIELFSLGLLTKSETPLMIRGVKRAEIIEQISEGDIKWSNLDYLIIDTCAGTHEETLAILRNLKPDKAIIVAQPNGLSLAATKKTIQMLKILKVKIGGIIENMSYFECPKCGQKTPLFSESAKELAKQMKIKYLGSIPFIPNPEVLPIKEEIIKKVMK